ncbi:hypothetical protein GCM10020218_097670 [Dactylosporangium vinaceum]
MRDDGDRSVVRQQRGDRPPHVLAEPVEQPGDRRFDGGHLAGRTPGAPLDQPVELGDRVAQRAGRDRMAVAADLAVRPDHPGDELVRSHEVLHRAVPEPGHRRADLGHARGRGGGVRRAEQVGRGPGPGQLGRDERLLDRTQLEQQTDERVVELQRALDGEDAVPVLVEQPAPLLHVAGQPGGAVPVAAAPIGQRGEGVGPGEVPARLGDLERRRVHGDPGLHLHAQQQVEPRHRGRVAVHGVEEAGLGVLDRAGRRGREPPVGEHADQPVAGGHQVRHGGHRARTAGQGPIGERAQRLRRPGQPVRQRADGRRVLGVGPARRPVGPPVQLGQQVEGLPHGGGERRVRGGDPGRRALRGGLQVGGERAEHVVRLLEGAGDRPDRVLHHRGRREPPAHHDRGPQVLEQARVVPGGERDVDLVVQQQRQPDRIRLAPGQQRGRPPHQRRRLRRPPGHRQILAQKPQRIAIVKIKILDGVPVSRPPPRLEPGPAVDPSDPDEQVERRRQPRHRVRPGHHQCRPGRTGPRRTAHRTGRPEHRHPRPRRVRAGDALPQPLHVPPAQHPGERQPQLVAERQHPADPVLAGLEAEVERRLVEPDPPPVHGEVGQPLAPGGDTDPRTPDVPGPLEVPPVPEHDGGPGLVPAPEGEPEPPALVRAEHQPPGQRQSPLGGAGDAIERKVHVERGLGRGVGQRPVGQLGLAPRTRVIAQDGADGPDVRDHRPRPEHVHDVHHRLTVEDHPVERVPHPTRMPGRRREPEDTAAAHPSPRERGRRKRLHPTVRPPCELHPVNHVPHDPGQPRRPREPEPRARPHRLQHLDRRHRQPHPPLRPTPHHGCQ